MRAEKIPLLCRRLEDHPVSHFVSATPPKEGNGPAEKIPLLRRGGGGAAGVVGRVFCGRLEDHPVSHFVSATPPKEGNGPPKTPLWFLR